MDCQRACVTFLVPSSLREPVAKRRGMEPGPTHLSNQAQAARCQALWEERKVISYKGGDHVMLMNMTSM